MNKHRRHEVKMLHYKRRLRNLKLKDGEGDFTAFRSHGQPCSCSVCRDEKYKRNEKHKKMIMDFEGL